MSPVVAVVVGVVVVFAVNLLPAFGPPTWSILVFFSIQTPAPALPLVLLGAVAAASGRYALASGTRRLRPRLSTARLARLDRVERAITERKPGSIAALALFAVSPLPSGQLFVAAGLLTVRLLPLTIAFFAGRLVSYSLYVTAADIAASSLGEIALEAMTSPLGVGVQLAMLAGLAFLAGFGWSGRDRDRRDRSPDPG